MRVLVYGATGLQSRSLIAHLLRRGHEPYALTRRPGDSHEAALEGAHLVRGDLADPASLVAACRGMGAISFMIPSFLGSPSQVPVYVESAIRAAQAGGVKIVVWNTSGRLPDPSETGPRAERLRQTWNLLKQSALPLIVIAPSKYMENLLGPWTAKSVRRLDQVSYPVPASRPMGWIAAADVSAFIAESIERPQLAGGVFRVSGAPVTGPQLAQAFSDVLGRRIQYHGMSLAEMQSAVEEVFGPGSGAGVVAEYGPLQDDPSVRPTFHDMEPVLGRLPIRMTTIREWLADHLQFFSKE